MYTGKKCVQISFDTEKSGYVQNVLQEMSSCLRANVDVLVLISEQDELMIPWLS